jgi:hypothetical protein
MRKLEAVTREIVDELGYLQRREMRMRDTNGQYLLLAFTYDTSESRVTILDGVLISNREYERPSQELFDLDHDWCSRSWRMAGELPNPSYTSVAHKEILRTG